MLHIFECYEECFPGQHLMPSKGVPQKVESPPESSTLSSPQQWFREEVDTLIQKRDVDETRNGPETPEIFLLQAAKQYLSTSTAMDTLASHEKSSISVSTFKLDSQNPTVSKNYADSVRALTA